MLTRPLTLQWVYGDPGVAETSFFKINSQGTPLDETEQTLIRNRRKAVAIGARAVVRSGSGHKYWSSFTAERQGEIEKLANEFFVLLFEPEAFSPLKTLDVPLGGSVSPVDALALLIEFLATAAQREHHAKAGSRDPGNNTNAALRKEDYYGADDETGEDTIRVLRRALEVGRRVTGNQSASLGLHPAVYFYNERGKHNRFLLLGMVSLISEKIRNNDDHWFKKFTLARSRVETFLIENKSLIGI